MILPARLIPPARLVSLARLAFAVALALGSPAFAAGPVMLTVTGAVDKANRGPSDPDFDVLFTFNEVRFDKAHAFDLDALAALPQASVRADFPKGGPEAHFTGPLLADVLAATGAEGDTVTVQAMDGYAVEAPRAELEAKGAVIALTRDGQPLGIGSFGPAQLVFPRSERADLASMPDDWWIWQIFHIKVN